MKTIFIFIVIPFFLLFSIQIKTTAQYKIPEKMNWWYDARFGMFIHFGSYSYLGHGEWAFSTENWTKTNYQENVSSKFNPIDFNAGTIARLAKKAGMKYLVITAKHHEGFCMWKTEVESFKDVTGTVMYDLPDFTQFKTRDILKELKDSCDAQGIKFCLYYSILDWSHSSQEIFHGQNWYTFSTMSSDADKASYIADMKTQLSELVDRYHPDVMWFDGDWTYNSGTSTPEKWWTKADGIDLYNYVIGLDSNIIVNERVFRGSGLGDFECPEQEVPAKAKSRQWETCRTMNGSWGYNASDNNYKTPKTLIQELVKVVSRDGNYLLNIGPKGDGSLTDQTVSILNGFENWMNIYSESIYGTTRSPYSTEPTWGFYTKKEGKLYAHVFTWPSTGKLNIPKIANTIKKIYLMNEQGTSLSYSDTLGQISIVIPTSAPSSINSVVVIEVNGVPSVSGTSDYDETKIEDKVSIFPNPIIDGKLTISYTGMQISEIIIYDVCGNQVMIHKTAEKVISFDVSGLPQGVFFAKIFDGENFVTRRFIKN